MAEESKHEAAAAAMRQINRTWLEGSVDGLAERVHPEIVMAFPGFAGSIQGRESFLARFRDFLENAAIEEFREQDLRADVVGETAVVTFRYEMVYRRSGQRYRATGRDLWVFQMQGRDWIGAGGP